MLRKLTKPAARKLIISSLYGIGAIVGIVNLCINGPIYSTPDLVLSILGSVPWCIGSAQNIYLSVQEYRKNCDEDNKPLALIDNEPPDPRSCIKRSTHSTINAALNLTASSVFIAADAIYLSGMAQQGTARTSPTILAIRCSGSGLWTLVASLTLIMAIQHQCRHDDNLHESARLLCMSSEAVNFSSEVLYLAAGCLYAYAIYTSAPINPLKATSNTLWLSAGMLGLLSALSELITKSKSCYVALATNIENESKSEVLIDIPHEVAITAPPLTSDQTLSTPVYKSL